MAESFTMRVKITPSEKEFEITVSRGLSLEEIKSLCCVELGETIAIKLVYRGKILKDTDDLSILQPNTVLFLVKEMKKAPEPVPSAQVPPQSNPPNTLPPNPFAGMGGMGANPGMPNFPNFSGMGGMNPGMNPVMNPGMGANPFGNMPMMNDPNTMNMMGQMMQNPAMRDYMLNTMQMMMATPQSREMLMSSNPMFANLMRTNPEMMNMLSNPAIIDMMRSMFSGGANPFGQASPQLNPMAGLLGANPPMVPTVQNPREVYASQIQQMKDMGFINEEKNIEALQSTGGDVNAAVEKLLTMLG